MPLPHHRSPPPVAAVGRAGAALAVGCVVLWCGSAGASAAPPSPVGLSLLVGTRPVAAAGALPQHARLTSSSPADGSTAPTVAEFVLTFSEEVNPSFVAVTVEGPQGDETEGGPVVDGREVRQTLASDLAAGGHVATFRVVSGDGHPVSGTVRFTTTQGPTSAPASPSGPPSSSAAVTDSPGASGPASPASSGSSTMTSWAVPGLGAVLLAGAIGWVLWRSRPGRSGGDDAEGSRGP